MNPVLIPGLLGYFIAQIIKVIRESVRSRHFSLTRMVGSGGMPSSHAAMVCATATSVAFVEGINSSLFALSAILAVIVMYDATGVRREAGRQAKAFNQLMEKLFDKGEVDINQLKELIGHEPIEVFVGALLGILIGVVWCLWIL